MSATTSASRVAIVGWEIAEPRPAEWEATSQLLMRIKSEIEKANRTIEVCADIDATVKTLETTVDPAQDDDSLPPVSGEQGFDHADAVCGSL